MFSIRNSSIGQPPIHFLSKQFAKPNFNLFGVYSVTKFRSFASTKKSAHGKKHAQDTVPDSSSNDDRDIAEECRQKMSMSLDKLRADFAQLRLGRANPSLLERVKIDGKPLNQFAHVVIKDAQTLNVIMHDSKNSAQVVKAIQTANLNLNPHLQSDNSTIRVPIPKMSTEYRDSMQKQVANMAEQAKQRMRGHRQDFRTVLKKCHLTKDDLRRVENQIQSLTEKFCKDIDAVVKTKSQEIKSS